MTERIPQSTAKTVYFKAYLSSDHATEATGKTIAITISKNKGAFGNPSAGATNATELSSGWYYVDLSTTDTGTVGPVAVRGAVATIDDVGVLLEVVNATNGGLTALPDTAVTTNASLLTSGTGTAQVSVSSGTVDIGKILGTAVSTPATAGILDVNVKNIDNDAASASGTVTFPNATLASTTNITAGTVTTATNVTTVNGLAAAVITAASIAADAITDAKVASDVTIASVTGAVGSVTGAVGSVTGAVGSVTGAVGSVTGNVGGNVTGSVGSVAAGGIVAASFAADSITAAKIADGAFDAATFASGALDAVWSTATRVLTAGTNIQLPSNGLANVTAWTVAFTGNITGNLSGSVGSVTGLTASNLDATISSRASQTSVDTIDDFVDTEVAAIKAKTDQLVFTVTNQLDVNVLDWKSATAPAMTGDAFARLGAPAGASVSADVAAVKAVDDAVKAKTDNLPASPAAVGSAMTLTGAYDAAKTAATQTSVDDLPTNAELATALAAADDATLAAVAALSIPTANQNADALLDRADAVEVGLTPRQSLRLAAAAYAGKLSGAATTTNTIRNAVADSKNRIVATVDDDGNRTAITYDLT